MECPRHGLFFMLISLLCFAAKSKVFVNQRFAEESLRVMLFLLLWARCIRIVLQTISVKRKVIMDWNIRDLHLFSIPLL